MEKKVNIWRTWFLYYKPYINFKECLSPKIWQLWKFWRQCRIPEVIGNFLCGMKKLRHMLKLKSWIPPVVVKKGHEYAHVINKQPQINILASVGWRLRLSLNKNSAREFKILSNCYYRQPNGTYAFNLSNVFNYHLRGELKAMCPLATIFICPE